MSGGGGRKTNIYTLCIQIVVVTKIDVYRFLLGICMGDLFSFYFETILYGITVMI